MQSRFWLYGLLLDFLSHGLQQSADGQGDALVLSVNIGDLDLDFLALSQNILGLADALVSDLRNVDQEMWIRPSTPGRISANAPKVISLTILASTTSPIW